MIHLYKHREGGKFGALVTDKYLVFEHPHRSPALLMSWKEIEKISISCQTKKEAVLTAEKLSNKTGQELALHN